MQLVEDGIQGFDVEVISPELVADEVRSAGATAALKQVVWLMSFHISFESDND